MKAGRQAHGVGRQAVEAREQARSGGRSTGSCRARRIAAHEGLVRLTGEFLTYNYDPGLLALEIGNLLASCAAASERADA